MTLFVLQLKSELSSNKLETTIKQLQFKVIKLVKLNIAARLTKYIALVLLGINFKFNNILINIFVEKIINNIDKRR